LIAALAHDLRTPLSAVVGEVDLALRRERPVEYYRDALARISIQVNELVEMTYDLSAAGASEAPDGHDEVSDFSLVFDLLAARWAAGEDVSIVRSGADGGVLGEAQRLVRALGLLCEHALRHRLAGSGPVRVAPGPRRGDSWREVVIVTSAPGFRPDAWNVLCQDAPSRASAETPGLFRLQTASRIIESCGGSIALDGRGEHAAVRVRLRDGSPAPPAG
jgi:light-regulated signal transduction histidine kinase (bacteriophytochrome)